MLRRTASRSRLTSWPATRAIPEVGCASVHKILIVVDLPAPFGPRKPNVSPAATSKSMPRTASISPYRLVSPLTRTAGCRSPPAPAAPACVTPAGSASVHVATPIASLHERHPGARDPLDDA